MRNHRAGSIQAAVIAAYRAVGGLENASHDLGVSISTLSYGTEISEQRPGGLGVNYLDRLGRIESGSAVPIAQHFALLAGGVFMPISASGGADIWKVSQHFSDVLRDHAAAHSDASDDPNDYTPAEAKAQIDGLDRLIAAAVTMRAALVHKAGGVR